MMELNLTNINFCINLLLHFPFAYDEDNEMMLLDFMVENYKMPSDEWFNELTGETDESGNEVEPWNGITYLYSINENVKLYVEFHPNEAIYFFNDTYLGNTGGHFHLSLLTWRELMKIVNHDKENPSLLFFLLLPLAVGTQLEKAEIELEIRKHLSHTVLNPEHFSMISKFLCRHIIFEDNEMNIFEEKDGVGLVCNRNHSERKSTNEETELIRINEIIKLATE